MKKLVELGYQAVSCIVIPKLLPDASKIIEDVGNLGFKITAPKLNGANYHFDIEAASWKAVLDKVFDLGFFDKYSFHLEKDVDDAPPVPTTSTAPKARKRLMKSSEVFIPPPADSPAEKPAEAPAKAGPAQPAEAAKPAEKKDGKRSRLLG